MAGITQKSCATLFPLWSLKKQWWGYINRKQQETFEKLKIEVDKVSDTDIILLLLLLIILTMLIILLLIRLLLLLPLIW